MMRSLYSGISGLKNHQTRMDVIGNNISNVNTIGFKTSRVVFQDIYSQTLRTGSAGVTPAADGTGGMGGTNPAQIGLGVKLGAIDVIHTSAPTQRTDNPLDLAIDGDGYFIVQNPQTGTDFYTRAGNFRLDDKGNLVTSDGYFVMGYGLEPIYSDTETVINRILATSRNGDAVWLDINPVDPAYLKTLQSSAVKTSKLAYDILKAEEAVYKAAAANAAAAAAAATPGTTLDTDIVAAAVTAAGEVAQSYADVNDAYIAAMTEMGIALSGLTGTAAISAAAAKAATAKADAAGLTLADEAAYVEACEKIAKEVADFVKYNPGASATDIDDLVNTAGDEVALIAAAASAAETNVTTGVTGSGGTGTIDYEAVVSLAEGLTIKASVVAASKKEYNDALKAESEAEKAMLKSITTAVEKAVKEGTFTLPAETTAAEYAQIFIDYGMKIVSPKPNTEEGPKVVGHTPDQVSGLAPINLADYVSIAVDFDGTIYGIKDDIREPIAILGTAMFANPSGLEKAGSSLYRKSGASGEPVETTPQTDGAGLVNGGGLEMSNVDLASEFTDMIVTQRGYQANSRIITVSDSMLEELVNLKR